MCYVLKLVILGDIKITQSNAILRYLGRKYNLEGKTEEEKVQVEDSTHTKFWLLVAVQTTHAATTSRFPHHILRQRE